MILFLIFSAIILYLWYTQLRKYNDLRKLPGPPAHNLLKNAFKNIPPTDVLNEMLNLNEKYGPLAKIWINPFKPTLFITDPKYIEYILSSTVHLDKSHLFKFFRPILGSALASSDGDEWKVQRKLMNPGFHHKLLENYVHVFEKYANSIVENLARQPNMKSVDVYPIMDNYALKIICATFLKTKHVDIDGEIDDRKTFATIAISRIITLFKQIDFFYDFTETARVQRQCLKRFNGFSQNIMTNRAKNMKDPSSDDIEEHGNMKVDLIDILLQDTSMTAEEQQFQINTIMTAGYVTVATTLSFALYELAKHPEIQTKILEETIAVLGKDKSAVITFHDLQQLKYLEMVIKEVMRLHTPVPLLDRKIKEDVTIDDIKIPGGTEIFICAYNLHRDAAYFPNPEVFDPERFNDENIDNIKPYTYIPFSLGPRNCIGKTYAILEMKTILAKIIRNFEILPAEPKHELQLHWEFVLSSSNGAFLRFKHR